jgi:hypothetical protein
MSRFSLLILAGEAWEPILPHVAKRCRDSRQNGSALSYCTCSGTDVALANAAAMATEPRRSRSNCCAPAASLVSKVAGSFCARRRLPAAAAH